QLTQALHSEVAVVAAGGLQRGGGGLKLGGGSLGRLGSLVEQAYYLLILVHNTL
nr:hypothetical protein [Tanacetum cinerariifolium]